jgi:MEMO1 family protein
MKYLIAILFTSNILFNAMGQEIRSIRDNVGYCWNAAEMDTFINFLSKDYKVKDYNSDNLIAAISPHDDYLYAGRVYFPLYKILRTKEVIIFGVTHGTVRKEMNDPKNILIFEDYKYWHGPYKSVEVSPLRDFIKNNLNKEYFITSDKAQNIEHSIEALIPFLQHYNRGIKITPIMVTEMSYERMKNIAEELSGIIEKYIKNNNLKLGKDIFFLMSTDANHYGEDFDNSPYGEDEKAHKTATEIDKNIANSSLTGDMNETKIKELIAKLWPDSTNTVKPLWCGRYPVPFGLLTTIDIIHKIKNQEIDGEVFKYSDTWTGKVLSVKNTHLGLTAPFSLKHWVGFLSAGFYLK